MQCLFYTFTNSGIMIKDTITENRVQYIGYTLRQAIKKHRIDNGLRYKHFRIIKL